MTIRMIWKSNISSGQCYNLYNMAKRKLSDYAGFEKVLNESKNIVCLTGAGISAESGIHVFRGTGGLWRQYEATSLATPEAFQANPSLVWEFYSYRRNVAFNAEPNNVNINKLVTSLSI